MKICVNLVRCSSAPCFQTRITGELFRCTRAPIARQENRPSRGPIILPRSNYVELAVRVFGMTTTVLLWSQKIAHQTMTPGVGPVCLGRRQFVCRCSPGLLLTDTRPSQLRGRTRFHQKMQQISTTHSN
ncbi:hypothetical protein TNCV_3103641 [Trichonephila clavipes]|nr:hypothetical protein TNCV_3103641 [Trichonephila clavipes]